MLHYGYYKIDYQTQHSCVYVKKQERPSKIEPSPANPKLTVLDCWFLYFLFMPIKLFFASVNKMAEPSQIQLLAC